MAVGRFDMLCNSLVISLGHEVDTPVPIYMYVTGFETGMRVLTHTVYTVFVLRAH